MYILWSLSHSAHLKRQIPIPTPIQHCSRLYNISCKMSLLIYEMCRSKISPGLLFFLSFFFFFLFRPSVTFGAVAFFATSIVGLMTFWTHCDAQRQIFLISKAVI